MWVRVGPTWCIGDIPLAGPWRAGQPGLCLLCPGCVSQKLCQEVANFDGVVTLRGETDYLLGGIRHAPVKLRRVAVDDFLVKPIPHESVGDGWRLHFAGLLAFSAGQNPHPKRGGTLGAAILACFSVPGYPLTIVYTL